MIDQDEIIRIVAKEYDLLLDKNDPILAFLAVHDTLLKARMEDFESDLQDSMRSIMDKYQDREKELAEKMIGDVVRKIAAERQEIQNGMMSLRQQEKPEIRELMKTMKLVYGRCIHSVLHFPRGDNDVFFTVTYISPIYIL